jgi:hypothetical protein
MESQGNGVSSQGTSTNRNGQSYIASVLSLPSMPSSSAYQRHRKQPAIDWSQSQVLTLDSNVMALEEAANLKESTAQAKEQRASERERKKAARVEERIAKAQKQREKQAEKAEKDRLNEYWKEVTKQGWGNHLQQLMKSDRALPPGSYVSVYYSTVPSQCIHNQCFRCLKQKFRKEGYHPSLVAPTTGPPCIAQPGFPPMQVGIGQYQNANDVVFFAP